jgi:hypothetical protein
MRRTITLASTLGALAASALVPSPALADRADCSAKLERNYSAYWHAVAHKARDGKLRKDAQGRNIRKQGVLLRKKDWRPARCHELRESLGRLKRLQNPPRYPTLTVVATNPAPPPAHVATATPRATGAPLSSIRQCESGGNYGAVSPTGQYRGAYQFNYETWASVGGSGDPAAASPAEQDMRAAMLYSRRGASPWPVCGQ